MPAPLVARSPADPDALARAVLDYVAIGRSLPDFGDGLPVLFEGRELGRILPGVGFASAVSLRRLGVTKPLPGVLEPSVWRRALDWARGNERAALLAAASAAAIAFRHGDAGLAPLLVGTLTSYDSIVAAIGAGRSHTVLHGTDSMNFTVSGAPAGIWVWPFHALKPGAFAFSSSLAATAPGQASAGAINGYFPAPAGGETPILSSVLEIQNSTIGVGRYVAHVLADVLYECGEISFATTSSQTLGTAALTRYTSGLGVFPVLVTTSATNNTNSTATVTYTNSAGTGSQTTSVAHPNNFFGFQGAIRPAGTIPTPFFDLADGDVGVRSVESIQWSTAGTGDFGLVLARPLAVVWGKAQGASYESDYLGHLQPVTFAANACLAMFSRANAGAGSFRDFESNFAFRFSSI